MIRDTPCFEEYALMDLLVRVFLQFLYFVCKLLFIFFVFIFVQPVEEKKKYWSTYYETPYTAVAASQDYNPNVFQPPETLKHRCDNSISLVRHFVSNSLLNFIY